MEHDCEGFWYPRTDATACARCGLCERVCPLLNANSLPFERRESPRVLAAWNRDPAVRLASTSGGVFSVLAERMFQSKGYVAGAAFSEDHTVSHVVTGDPHMLDALRGSKYVQSYVGDIPIRVRQLLHDGKHVLFCGAPCQIAGLYHVLGGDSEGLVTCDFICRGVNSPRVFLGYLDTLERQYGATARRIRFKDKTYGWHRFSTRIEFTNGKTYICDRYRDCFMQGYLQYNCFARPSCYSCSFKKMPRQADITLGDFWGLNVIHPELDDDCGTSAVLINSAKGQEFFHSASHALFHRECTLEEVHAYNPALSRSLEYKPGRDRFFHDLERMSFAKLSRKHCPGLGRLRILAVTGPARAKRAVRTLWACWRNLGLSLPAWLQFLRINLFRKGARTNAGHRGLFIPAKLCRIVMGRGAQIVLNGTLTLGWKEFRKSTLETRFRMGRNGKVVVNGNFTVYNGSDIRVYDNGVLTLNGGFCNMGVQIVCAKRISLGQGVAIARDVIIRDYDAHEMLQPGYETARDICIGDHVWVGTRAVILKGVTIGDGAVVAAGAVVTRDVPARCLVAGVPAKMIREHVEWQ